MTITDSTNMLANLKIRVIEPSVDIHSAHCDATGEIDVHLSMKTETDGQHLLTIGSKIDGEWVPLKFREPNRWWDRLSYVPKRYRKDNLKPKEGKREIRRDSASCNRLSQRPPRREVPVEQIEPIKRGRSPLHELSEPWWDRLSQLPWVQAENLRSNFPSLHSQSSDIVTPRSGVDLNNTLNLVDNILDLTLSPTSGRHSSDSSESVTYFEIDDLNLTLSPTSGGYVEEMSDISESDENDESLIDMELANVDEESVESGENQEARVNTPDVTSPDNSTRKKSSRSDSSFKQDS